MILRNTILLTILGGANAQGIVPSIFNSFSGIFINIFNSLVSDGLADADPFALDTEIEQSLGDISTPSCSDVSTEVSFTINDLTGLSTVEINQLEMTEFCFGFPDFKVGLEFEAGIELLSADFEGTISGEGCGESTEQMFTGSASLTEAEFKFGFDADMTIEAGFSLNSVNIESFSLTWENLTVDFSDLGDFDEVAETLTDTLTSSIEDAVNTLVNATVLQDGIDAVVPFSIP